MEEVVESGDQQKMVELKNWWSKLLTNNPITKRKELLLEDTKWIDEEANFVDEMILKIGRLEEIASAIKRDSLASDYCSVKQGPIELAEEERVKSVAKCFKGVRVPSEVLKKYQKNTEVSGLLRDRGNVLYNQKNYGVALHYYNLALMFAEMDSEAAGMAYANRAAVLVELGHFEEALEDVDLASKNKYPESKSSKLEQRRAKCEESIMRKQQEYEAIEPKVKKEMEAEMAEMRKLGKVKKSNLLMPSAAEFVQVKFDSDQGRHLVVNQDVPPGTVVIVEQPYAFALNGQSKWNSQHCHNCLKRIRRGVPCEDCVFAFYCGERCRLEAKKLHSHECKFLPSFHSLCFGELVLMAMRIILKVGPKALFELFQTKDPAYFNQFQPPFGTELDDNCTYDSESYLSVFHLTTQSDKFPFSIFRLAENARTAVQVTDILDTGTGFFQEVPLVHKTDFKNFVARLVLRHLEAAGVNGQGLAELEGLDNVSFQDTYSGKKAPAEALQTFIDTFKLSTFGGGIYPTLSLTNHSCDPNVTCVADGINGTVTVVTHRMLRKGEPLFSAYNESFLTSELKARTTILLGQYHFRCHCIACEQNWPTLQELSDRIRVFCCPDCSKKFFEHEKGSGQFRTCLLTAPHRRCGSCGKRYKEAELDRQLNVTVGLAVKVRELLKSNRPMKAFEILLKILDYFQYRFCPPNAESFKMQISFRQALYLIFHLAQTQL